MIYNQLFSTLFWPSDHSDDSCIFCKDVIIHLYRGVIFHTCNNKYYNRDCYRFRNLLYEIYLDAFKINGIKL